MSADPGEMDTEEKPRRPWWHWALGLLLLLALCDDDDDKPREYCYEFGNETRCFAGPLPKDKFCYLEADDAVRCYDKEF